MLTRLALAFLVVILGSGAFLAIRHTADVPALLRPAESMTISLFFGGEKGALLHDPAVVEILTRRYGVTLDAQKAGSIEQATDPVLLAQKKDCRWPSSQTAYDLYAQSTGSAPKRQNIFNSPMVIYTWMPTAQALMKAGIVEQRGASYYLVDMPRLVAMIQAKTPWKDLHLPYFGTVKIHSSDPARSNSGNMFAGLLATLLNGGEVVSEDRLDGLLPVITGYFKAMGQMDHTSSDMFEGFLGQGEGGRPLTIGYENQIVEYVLLHPEATDLLRRKVVMLYPVPTVWSAHPLIAESRRCERLITALQDPELQKIAWEKHGFRSGLIGVTNDPKVLAIAGIPETIDAVVPMPTAGAMRRIIEALSQPQPERSNTW